MLKRLGLQTLTSDLRNRLLVLLLLPLCVLAGAGVWLDYQSADVAAERHDQKLLRLLPALMSSVLSPPPSPSVKGAAPDATRGPTFLLLAPPVEEFLRQNPQTTGFSVRDKDGQLLFGSDWINPFIPATFQPEFHSVEQGGVTYRIAVQRDRSDLGELVVALADGSDPRQNWAQQLLRRVVLPNIILILATGIAIGWAVRRAFAPLVALADAVEHRSPQDLSPIDELASPSEVRPLVRSLNRLFSLVNAQAESQRRFVADAAHQLRTPLAGLQSQVEAWALTADIAQRQALSNAGTPTADRAALPGQGHTMAVPLDQVYKLRAATRRTSQLAHQLLTLSRADARTANTQSPERVDLKVLCENLLEAFWDAASAKSLDLGLDTQACHVTGHAWLLRELLSNVIDNAIRYTPRSGVITVRCGYRPGYGEHPVAFIEVEDSGPGIAAEEREQATQRFYRLPGTVGDGTGLGLAIAQEIAQLHQAMLVLGDGAHQQGLMVTVLFPSAPC